jgi:hypothetical protein
MSRTEEIKIFLAGFAAAALATVVALLLCK